MPDLDPEIIELRKIKHELRQLREDLAEHKSLASEREEILFELRDETRLIREHGEWIRFWAAVAIMLFICGLFMRAAMLAS